MTTADPTYSATHSPELQTLTPLPSSCWGLSDRASLIGEWSEAQIAMLDRAFPEIIKALEAKLLTGELDAQRQHCITIQHSCFICEADTLGSHGYVYIAIYPAISADITHCAKA